MNSVNKTLYIPLYGKAYVSKKGLFIKDKKAEEIWQLEGFKLKGKAKSKWLAYYMGIRCAVFDNWVTQTASEIKDTIVIHIGCGMDSRVLRIGNINLKWYDIDFPEVINEKKRYFTETTNYKMISSDVRTNSFLESIPERKNAIIVMEGISMYLSFNYLKDLISSLCNHFENLSLLVDCYSVLGEKLSKYKNPINNVGVSKVYGIDKPESLENNKFRFIKEHNMTPIEFINELHGFEKFVFKKLYAGSLSKKLYRLYEYKKV